jgi:hypothetical protein
MSDSEGKLMNKFNTNQELLEKQLLEFTSDGRMLKNIYSISSNHPWLSLLFVLSFGLLVNSVYGLIAYIFTEPPIEAPILRAHFLFVALFVALPIGVLIYIRSAHKDLFVPTALNQKKVLITMISKSRSDFKQTPSYSTYESLVYNNAGHSVPNALQRVILVVTEDPGAIVIAEAFKAYIEKGDRAVEIFSVMISDKSILEMQMQMELLFGRLKKDYKPHEIVADYTGGTKDMSIALLKASEKELIVPVYLKEATIGIHSKYS